MHDPAPRPPHQPTAGPPDGPDASSGVTGPLAGRRVVVTRAAVESDRLAERLGSLGAEVDVVPLIASAPPTDGGVALAAAMDDAVAGNLHWVVVTSPTGARQVVEVLAGRRPAAQVCAVGPGTAEVLATAGIPVDLVPARHVGEGIAAEFPDAPVSPPEGGAVGPGWSPRVAVVRAAVARDVVPDALAARGWAVEVVESHRTVTAPVSPQARARLARADAVTLTSSSTATALAGIVAANPDLDSPPVVCIGPETAATAAAHRLVTLAVADPHSLDGLVDAVVVALGPVEGTRRPGALGPEAGAPETGS